MAIKVAKTCKKIKGVIKMIGFKTNLDNLFSESKTLENEIQKKLNGLKYE
jgi:hypothetical protein